jgi:hypothetical protein
MISERLLGGNTSVIFASGLHPSLVESHIFEDAFFIQAGRRGYGQDQAIRANFFDDSKLRTVRLPNESLVARFVKTFQILALIPFRLLTKRDL